MKEYYLGLLIVIFISMYIVQAIGFYKISRKVNFKSRWISFIPFFQNIILLKIIDKNNKNIILFFIPIVNVIAYIIFYVKFYEKFNIDMPWIIFSIIALPIGEIMILKIAFSHNIKYLDESIKDKPCE